MSRLLVLCIVSFFAMTLCASANGVMLQCSQGSLAKRVKCLTQAVEKLSGEIGALREELNQRPTKTDVENMIKAATDQVAQGTLKYGSVVTLQSEARPGFCIDKRSQDENTIQAWRCNNDNNHRLQHWQITAPN